MRKKFSILLTRNHTKLFKTCLMMVVPAEERWHMTESWMFEILRHPFVWQSYWQYPPLFIGSQRSHMASLLCLSNLTATKCLIKQNFPFLVPWHPVSRYTRYWLAVKNHVWIQSMSSMAHQIAIIKLLRRYLLDIIKLLGCNFLR